MSIILCCNFHNLFTKVLYFHHNLLPVIRINLTSLLEWDGYNIQVPIFYLSQACVKVITHRINGVHEINENFREGKNGFSTSRVVVFFTFSTENAQKYMFQ